MRRTLCVLLSLLLGFSVINVNTYASEQTEDIINDEFDSEVINDASATTAIPKTVGDILDQYKFRASQGHGFAAERGNNLADQIKGKNAKVVGDNNLLDGPDRLIINRDGTVTYIQDKYYKTASESVNSAFRDGKYRYMNGDKPMQLEVPKDQYPEAVEAMKEKIKAGQVEGVTDPEKASELVRPGNITYEQAVNLTKPGNIDSLKYDAANGVVSAGSALGISTILNYSVLRLNGFERKEALQQSAIEGVKTGGLVFCSSVIAGQLAKTALVDCFKESSEAIVKFGGKRFANALLSSAGKATVDNLSQTVIESAAKVLRSNAIICCVELVVFSTPDAVNLFRGRISKTQFIKNFATIAASIAGGVAGGVVGSATLPVAGTFVGGLVGGTAAGLAADAIGDYFFEDDAEQLYGTIETVFSQCCEDYLVTEEEANNVAEALNKKLTDKTFKDIYQSEDREGYIKTLVEPLFVEETSKRPPIEEPSEEEMRAYLKEQLKGEIHIH